MNLPQNIKTFLTSLPLKRMRGEDLFVALGFFLAEASTENEISTRDIEAKWSKTLFGKSYNSGYANRAHGRVDPVAAGKIRMTDEGITYVERLRGTVPSMVTSLRVFKKGNAHSFDRFLRDVLRDAKVGVDIADTYVSGSLFDTLLDEIPERVKIRFAYGNDVGGFAARAGRFAKQYDFTMMQSNRFHDRFLVVDGRGYIIGPSLKDAADKKPATLVVLGSDDSKELVDLFSDIWSGAL